MVEMYAAKVGLDLLKANNELKEEVEVSVILAE
jgi:hypothetical protein